MTSTALQQAGASSPAELVLADERKVAGSITPATGTYALASMSDEEFQRRLETLVKGRERAKAVMRACMEIGVHFGWLPGQDPKKDKPGMFKPGGELLRQMFNYVADTRIDEIVYGDPANETSPAIRVRVRSEVHAGTLDGPIVGVGYGTSSSWEVKYRYRNAQRTCPSCGKATIIKSKFEERKGVLAGTKPFVCLGKMGGCGAVFGEKDPAILEQVLGKVANPDAHDLENTLVKMAEKRANVDSTINATGTSELFTQDIEDMGPEEPPAATAPHGAPVSREIVQEGGSPLQLPTIETPIDFGPADWRGKKLADLGPKALSYILGPTWTAPQHTMQWQSLARQEVQRRRAAKAQDLQPGTDAFKDYPAAVSAEDADPSPTGGSEHIVPEEENPLPQMLEEHAKREPAANRQILMRAVEAYGIDPFDLKALLKRIAGADSLAGVESAEHFAKIHVEIAKVAERRAAAEAK